MDVATDIDTYQHGRELPRFDTSAADVAVSHN
jgi:hypothetical protein